MSDGLIGKDQIAEALRYVDALSEEHQDLPAFWRDRGIDVEGLTYVAMQHGLRAVMVMKGLSPNLSKATPIRLSPDEEAMLVKFAGSFLTGFATHLELERINA